MTDERLARVLRICEEALACEGTARDAYLHAACGADDGLRREVEALLARRDDSRDGFLAAPPWQGPAHTLAAGHRLGPYELTGPLGAGGMGAVYKARDTRLGRTVAIKVIAGGAEMGVAARERLAREAQAVAAINHPNICAIYDVGRELPPVPSDPVDFLVMEYLEGQTLADRIAAGRLDPQEALQIAIQVADGLAAAHRQGVIHGDLKPANIMLLPWPAGPVAKLLDFGLAELTPAHAEGAPHGRGARGSASAPAGGMRGTLPYMAPERLEGHETDTRTDLFALGCVLYEMLTGKRPFTGDTESRIMSAIITSDPPAPSSLRPVIPPALDTLTMRCLAKDPRDRWQSAADVSDRLREMVERESMPGRSVAPRTFRRWSLTGVAAVALLGSLVTWADRHFTAPAVAMPRTLILPAPEGVRMGGGQGLEFSSDGGAIVYWGTRNDVPVLYWQNLDETDPRLIPGTESPGQNTLAPFASPDGGWLGFVHGADLVKVRIHDRQGAQGNPESIVRGGIGWLRGVSWGDGGAIVYSPKPVGGLWLASADGGPARELTRPDPSKAELSHSWPQVLPGGRAAIFTIRHASGRQDRSAIAAVDLRTGGVTKLLDGGSYARYAPSGHLVYGRNGSLFAVPFDLASLSVKGRPTCVLTGVSMESAGSGSARFAISSAGALAYEPALPRPDSKNSLIRVDHDGGVELAAPDRLAFTQSLALSPDGEQVAVRVEDVQRRDSQLWIYDLRNGQWRRLTSEGDNAAPLWSPTGDRIAFSSNRDGAFNLYLVPADGHAPAERLTRSRYWQYPCSWSPDGRLLAYEQQESDAGFDLWVLPLDGDREARRWGPQNVNAMTANFSRDGRWVAYQSQESGRAAVYLRPFSAPGPARRVSGANGGTSPLWSRDGRSVLYVDGASVMAARVTLGEHPQVSPPHLAFPLPFAPSGGASLRYFGITADRRHLVLVRPDQERTAQSRRLLVIPDWARTLKAKVPPA